MKFYIDKSKKNNLFFKNQFNFILNNQAYEIMYYNNELLTKLIQFLILSV